MLPLQERSNILENLLPDDPKDRQIVEYPEGQIVGASTVLSVYKSNKHIGALTSLYPITNVSRKYSATRLASNTAIKEKDIIRICAQQFAFNSVIFVQFFGWMGYKVIGEPQTISDKFYKVLATIPIGPKTAANFFLYEKVCLESLEVKSNGKSTKSFPRTSKTN